MHQRLRAVTYARVSTDEQAENGSSLRDQQAVTEEFCSKRGFTHVAHFQDEISGTLRHRPGLAQAERLAREGAFDVLICTVLDRVARMNSVREEIEESLRAQGVSIVYANGMTFEDNPEGELMKGIVGEFAGYELRKIKQRTNAGKERKAKERGVTPNGNKIFGYHTVSVAEAKAIPEFCGRSGDLLPLDEHSPFVQSGRAVDEVSIVREMFARAAEGQSMRVIALWLTENAVVTKFGRRYWTAESVRTILKNPVYTGTFYYGRSAWTDTKELTAGGNVRQRERRKPKEEWIELKSPAIISQNTFDAVQRRLSESKASFQSWKDRHNPRFPLAGVVFCGVCQGKRGGHLRCKGYRRASGLLGYECASRLRMDLENCGTRHTAKELEALALATLVHFAEPGRLAAAERARAEKELEASRGSLKDLERIDKAIAAQDAAEESVALLIEKGVSERVWQKRLDAAQATRDALLKERGMVIARCEEMPDPASAARSGEELARLIRQELRDAEADPEKKRIAFRRLRIYLFPNREPRIDLAI